MLAVHVKGHVLCCEVAVLFSPLFLFCWLTGKEYVALTKIFPTTMENTVESKPKNVVWKLFQRLTCFILSPTTKFSPHFFPTLNIRIGWLWFFFLLLSEVALVHCSPRFSQCATSSLLRFALTANLGLSAKGPRTHHLSAPTFLQNTFSMTTSE